MTTRADDVRLADDALAGSHSLQRLVKRRTWTHEQETEEMLRNTSRPEIRACIECGENAPEHGLICDECRLDAMGD